MPYIEQPFLDSTKNLPVNSLKFKKKKKSVSKKLQSPKKGHGGWKNMGWEERIYFNIFRIHPRHFAWGHKELKCFERPRSISRGNTNVLRKNAKFVWESKTFKMSNKICCTSNDYIVLSQLIDLNSLLQPQGGIMSIHKSHNTLALPLVMLMFHL